MNALCLTFAISCFVLLCQPLFAPCLFEKSAEKASVYRKAFSLKIMAGVHSSLERNVIDLCVKCPALRAKILVKSPRVAKKVVKLGID